MAVVDREAELLERLLVVRQEQELARQHPAFLLDHVRMVDEKTGEAFRFHLVDESSGWFWQRDVLDGLVAEQKTIILKARQLGITWLCGGYQLWEALTRPGTLHLCFRQREDDVVDLVRRIWAMFESLPDHLRFGVEVLVPMGGHRPTTTIAFRHPNGDVSTIKGYPSTESAGRGQTAASVLFDEAAFIDRFRSMWTGTTSTVGTKGKVFVVSTANGRSDDQTGDGNWYHRLWVTAAERGIHQIFLGWQKHPERDQEWYDTSDETRALDHRERAQEYPTNPEEAFRLSGGTWFDVDALEAYAARSYVPGSADDDGSPFVAQPLYRFEFRPSAKDKLKARKDQSKAGAIRVYREPVAEHSYAIGADVASGHGKDFSAAYVVDLTNMELVAEVHGKLTADDFAYQLHYLGKWFGKSSGCAKDALLAVEASGTGWGSAVISELLDPRSGRPRYARMFRNVMDNQPTPDTAKPYGFPINGKTRPKMLTFMAEQLRERTLPWVTSLLLDECSTFTSEHKSGTTPRAAAGMSDDCVMGGAMTLEMFRRKGHWPERRRPAPGAAQDQHWLSLGDERPAVASGRSWPLSER